MKKIINPIIVGVAQYTQAKDAEHPLDPLSLMAKTCRKAFDDVGSADIGSHIDSVYVTSVFGWSYFNTAAELSESLGLKSKINYNSYTGGNIPQTLVNKAARAIASGESRMVLLTGGESGYAIRRSNKGKVVLDWPKPKKPESDEDDYNLWSHKIEASYDLVLPIYFYPLFEIALRASSGRSPKEHADYIGKICERFSRVASQNPYAWSKKAYSAKEITTPTPGNRYIAYPYTMLMNSNLYVDQSAALIMTTEETAERLGIDRSRWVYPMGGADLNNIWYVVRRPRLHDSPALRESARLALGQAGLTIDDIGAFDFYSCFPCMIEIAQQELDLSDDDPREITVTGGLPYFGGPFNNYSMHAIATMVERIRKDRSLNAMVTAQGLFNTKHSIGIYGSTPPANPWTDRDDSAVQRAIDAEALPEPVEKADGLLTIESFFIRHGSDGQPERGTVIGRLENGLRTLAHIDTDVEGLLKMEQIELVGKTGKVRFDSDSGHNFVSIDFS